MRSLALFVFVIGIALAGGGAYYGAQIIGAYEEALSKNRTRGVETVRVIVAREDIAFGQRILEKDVKWAEWPKDSVPEGVFTEAVDFLGPEEERETINRTALQAIYTNEPLLPPKVTGIGEAARMAYNLSPGKRAFSFPINASTGVAGFVQAGDRVDILLTRQDQNNSNQMISEVFMQDVLVIAVDQQTNTQQRTARVGRIATVEVDPIGAQKLTVAQTRGKLSMTLRGIDEVVSSTDQMVPISEEDLFPTDQEVLEERAPEIEPTKVRVRRAGDIQDVEVE